MIRLPRAAVWAVAILLAVAFVASGMSKLEGASAMRWAERFRHWGSPQTLVCRRNTRNSRWSRCADSTMETSRFPYARRPHDRRVVHARRERRIRANVPPLVLGGLAFLMYVSAKT